MSKLFQKKNEPILSVVFIAVVIIVYCFFEYIIFNEKDLSNEWFFVPALIIFIILWIFLYIPLDFKR